MSIASYDDLQATVARFAKRGDLTAMIPDFIMLAETSLNRSLNTTAQRTSFSLTPTSPFVTLPSDLSKIIKVTWAGHPLEFIPENRTAVDASYQTDIGYAIEGGKLFLQVPQLGSVLRIEYYQDIEALSEANTSNWLLEDGPDVYLFATLIQIAIFTRDDDRLTLWTQAYEQVLSDLIENDADSLIPENTPLVMKAG